MNSKGGAFQATVQDLKLSDEYPQLAVVLLFD